MSGRAIVTEHWGEAGVEPSLQEVMAEPIVHLVMRRDGLSAKDVWLAVLAAQRRAAMCPPIESDGPARAADREAARPPP